MGARALRRYRLGGAAEAQTMTTAHIRTKRELGRGPPGQRQAGVDTSQGPVRQTAREHRWNPPGKTRLRVCKRGHAFRPAAPRGPLFFGPRPFRRGRRSLKVRSRPPSAAP